jgi:uncharacterized protein
MAKAIVEHRQQHLFEDRTELLKVSKFSAKAYEQGAGFLRIMSGKVVLDRTGIHPERYAAIRDMAHELSLPISDLVGEGARKLVSLRTKWAAIVGEFTFDDIIKELEKPGRDPRDPFKVFQFRDDIFEVKDLQEGMICPGLVTNVTNFGAFVDIGVHQDGLVHISELSHKFVDDPRKVVNPGDQVTIRVLGVDLNKNQISLSMKLEAAPARTAETAPRETRPRPAPRPAGARAPQGSGGAPREPRRDDRRSDNRRPDNRAPSAQQHGRGDRRAPPPPPAPKGKPFNNPFAALQGVPTNKK